MPRAGQVRGPGGRIDQRSDRGASIGGGDTRAHATPGVHRHGERGPIAGRVGIDHHGNLQLVEPLPYDWHADQPTPVTRHEVDGLRRHVIRGDCEIALVLPILVIHDDDELTVFEILYRLFDAAQWHTRLPSEPTATMPGLLRLPFPQGCFPRTSR